MVLERDIANEIESASLTKCTLPEGRNIGCHLPWLRSVPSLPQKGLQGLLFRGLREREESERESERERPDHCIHYTM